MSLEAVDRLAGAGFAQHRDRDPLERVQNFEGPATKNSGKFSCFVGPTKAPNDQSFEATSDPPSDR